MNFKNRYFIHPLLSLIDLILDTTKAEQILNQTGMPRKTLVLGADENATRNSLFQEMVYLRFEDGYNSKVDEDLDEELSQNSE